MKLKVGDVEGMISICIPYFLMEPIMDKLSSQQWFASTGRRSDEGAGELVRRHLDRVRVPVALELGHTVLSVSDILQVSVGDVIKLDDKVGDLLDVRVGNSVKFRAVPGTSNGNFAAEISEVIRNEDDMAGLPGGEGGSGDD
jgi:flagellar motor switch protein FliM